MDLELSPTEARVLGSLLEKQRTVPATYPLTIKALIGACNQSSSREPVMELSEIEVEAAIERLKELRLVRRLLPTHGNRQVKYRQVADEVLALDDAQRAVLTVMLLRGPQTPQQLKTRAERLHPFADIEEVEATLTDMAGWGDPLVRLLTRRSGQRDARWAHLLSGEPTEPEAGSTERSSRGAASRPESPVPPVEPALHGALAGLVGSWAGPGQGHYPTIEGFAYAEQIEVTPVPGKPHLAYRSATTAADDGRGLHGESGFLRLTGEGEVELVVASGPGVVEICSGLVEQTGDGLELTLVSETVAAAPTAKEVGATERIYRVDGDTLTYDLSMAAVGQPMAHHLRATLRRLR